MTEYFGRQMKTSVSSPGSSVCTEALLLSDICGDLGGPQDIRTSGGHPSFEPQTETNDSSMFPCYQHSAVSSECSSEVSEDRGHHIKAFFS